jgi:hypothetical protein
MNYGKSILKRFAGISNIDLSGYVQKVTGKSLISDTEITRLANVTGGTLTSEQLAAIAAQVDISGKVDKITGYRLVSNTEIGNFHAPGSDNQDLSGKQDLLGYTPVSDQDLRLTNARTPTAHQHTTTDIEGTAVITTDPRLSDARIPTTHSHTYPLFNSVYRTILDSTGSHIAARAANTYWIGQGQAIGVTGVGTLYAPNLIYIDSADYPAIDSKVTRLRIRCVIACNDVAPFVGTFTVGLHPVTRPAVSGGAGLCIYTVGASIVASRVVGTNLAADSLNNLVSADFDLPANGFYVLGVVTSAVMATSSHCHISASLQIRNN